MKNPRLFLLEFNELCPSLLADFMARGMLPNFQRLHDTSDVYITDAGEEAPQLEPWIQWLTVHSGRPYAEHRAFHLNDGRNLAEKCVAELLSDAGFRVGVLGSMNTNYQKLNGYYIPDPWDAKAMPHPSWLTPFFNTVASQVQESSSNGGLPTMALARFGIFMLRHGLRWRTVKAGLKQLASELKDPKLRWRRASLLEKIQYDLFLHLERNFAPHFATFFCNSTAHYQHYYWRNMHPEIFEIPPDSGDHPSLRTAIQYGYEQMDELVGRFLDDFPDVTLMLCTALSQQPWTETTKCTYRPRAIRALLELAGIPYSQVRFEPVMAEQFRLELASHSAAADAAEKLVSLRVGANPLMNVETNGPSLFAGCALFDAGAMRDHIATSTGASVQFRDYFYMVHSVRSGRHHPDGVLWIREGRGRVHNGKVALMDLAPTILHRFGVDCPADMNGRPLDLPDQYETLATANSSD